jgi:hypothetical protein
VSNNDGSIETGHGSIKVKTYMKPKIELSDFTGLLGKFINILRLGELNIFPEEKEPEVPPPIEDNLDDNKTHNEEQHLNNTDIITPVVVKETKLVT